MIPGALVRRGERLRDYYLELVRARVAPADRPWEEGIPVAAGMTQPFVVQWAWAGPSGVYEEQWSIRSGDRIVYLHAPGRVRVRGQQSLSTEADRVDQPVQIEPGTYELVFVVEGYRMGSVEVAAGAPEELAERRAAAASAVAAPKPVAAAAAATRPAGPVPAEAASRAAPAPAAAPARPGLAGDELAGMDPAEVRRKVYEEEVAKGSDPRVAEGRAKAAEMRVRKAAAARSGPAPAAPTEAPAPPAAPSPGEGDGAPVGEAAGAAPRATAPVRPGMTPEEAAGVRKLVYREAVEKGTDPKVAEALAAAAEVRARRGPWWRPDW